MLRGKLKKTVACITGPVSETAITLDHSNFGSGNNDQFVKGQNVYQS